MPDHPPTEGCEKARFRDVLAYIDANLDGELSLARLSRVARSSTFHFHRRFTERFGVALHRYVKLARLRRAAYQLAFRPRLRVIDVTLASGYGAPEAFARAFKAAFGLTPSEFRARPDWQAWRELDSALAKLRALADRPADEYVVHVEHVAPVRVAALEVRGAQQLPDAIRRFIGWRMENGLSPDRSATYNVFPDPGSHGAIDLCAATRRAVPPNAAGVLEKWLPGGRCAILAHVGTHASLMDAARTLATDWLARSGERARDVPLVIRRISLFPDVAAHLAESEIALPLACPP